MKKNWEDAVLENIDIAETAGGKYNTGKPDGEWFYYDGSWYQPGGTDNKIS